MIYSQSNKTALLEDKKGGIEFTEDFEVGLANRKFLRLSCKLVIVLNTMGYGGRGGGLWSRANLEVDHSE